MRQTTLDGSADQFGSEEGKRDRHVDMTEAASLAQCDLVDAGDLAGNQRRAVKRQCAATGRKEMPSS
jgi:hypothetical protein